MASRSSTSTQRLSTTIPGAVTQRRARRTPRRHRRRRPGPRRSPSAASRDPPSTTVTTGSPSAPSSAKKPGASSSGHSDQLALAGGAEAVGRRRGVEDGDAGQHGRRRAIRPVPPAAGALGPAARRRGRRRPPSPGRHRRRDQLGVDRDRRPRPCRLSRGAAERRAGQQLARADAAGQHAGRRAARRRRRSSGPGRRRRRTGPDRDQVGRGRAGRRRRGRSATAQTATVSSAAASTRAPTTTEAATMSTPDPQPRVAPARGRASGRGGGRGRLGARRSRRASGTTATSCRRPGSRRHRSSTGRDAVLRHGGRCRGATHGPMADSPRFLTLADVAEVLNTSSAQVYALVRRGELPAIKIGGRGQWRVEASAAGGLHPADVRETRTSSPSTRSSRPRRLGGLSRPALDPRPAAAQPTSEPRVTGTCCSLPSRTTVKLHALAGLVGADRDDQRRSPSVTRSPSTAGDHVALLAGRRRRRGVPRRPPRSIRRAVAVAAGRSAPWRRSRGSAPRRCAGSGRR